TPCQAPAIGARRTAGDLAPDPPASCRSTLGECVARTFGCLTTCCWPADHSTGLGPIVVVAPTAGGTPAGTATSLTALSPKTPNRIRACRRPTSARMRKLPGIIDRCPERIYVLTRTP